jgi:hypothetical protein
MGGTQIVPIADPCSRYWQKIKELPVSVQSTGLYKPGMRVDHMRRELLITTGRREPTDPIQTTQSNSVRDANSDLSIVWFAQMVGKTFRHTPGILINWGSLLLHVLNQELCPYWNIYLSIFFFFYSPSHPIRFGSDV